MPLASFEMYKKCPNCRLVNFTTADVCVRCELPLTSDMPAVRPVRSIIKTIARRGGVCLLVCLIILAGFYLSLVGSARSLAYSDKQSVKRAIRVLREKGFSGEAFLLDYVTVFRSDDNWLNASVDKENAYAATNFPFEIMTIYPDFFDFPRDDIERAAILLHESKHLEGKNEPEAYEFVWRHRKQLGWTADQYRDSPVWNNIRKQTKEIVPKIFVCDANKFSDCTEEPN